MQEKKFEVRTLVASDDVLRQHGWKALPNLPPILTFCGIADSTPVARRLVEELKPDLVLLDLNLPEGDPLDLCRELKKWKQGAPKILAFGAPEDGAAEGPAVEALKAGVQGYLDRGHTAPEIARAICEVLEGEVSLSRILNQKLLHYWRAEGGKRRPLTHGAILSEREKTIWRLLGKNLSTPRIVQQLGCSIKTVETHYGRMLHKLDLPTLEKMRQRARVERQHGP